MIGTTEARRLTAKQSAVYNFLWDYFLATGAMPTVRELCEHFGAKSTNAVTCHLEALRRHGLVAFGGGKSRSVRLVGVRVCLEFEDGPAGGRARQAREGGQ